MTLPKEFHLPTEYRYEETLDLTLRAIQYAKQVTGEVAVYAGLNLIAIKEHEGHGNWYRALDHLDLSQDQAERLMKIARAFEDNPAIINGLSQRKALQIAAYMGENLIQLRGEQTFIDADGNVFTMQDIREQVNREVTNMQNKKNAELKDLRDKHNELLREKAAMEKDYETQLAINEKLREDSNKAMAEEIRKLNELKQKLHDEIDRLRMEMEEKNEERVEGEEAIRALVDAGGGLAHMMSCLNKVKVRKGYDPELRAQYYGFIRKARELLKMAEERVSAYFGPLIDIDPMDIAHEE